MARLRYPEVAQTQNTELYACNIGECVSGMYVCILCGMCMSTIRFTLPDILIFFYLKEN